jgi:predicted MFS family arabinose efflux permease
MATHDTVGPREQWATRVGFFIGGLGMASWAPLVPYARERLAISEGPLGLLLLCLGAGSLATMPVTGALVGRFGCRATILIAGAGIAATLPLLATATSVPLLALALFLFGAALGALTVAINVQAVIVEKASGKSMMSGFHGLFSVGGIAGAGGVSVLLLLGLRPLLATLAVAAVLVGCLAAARAGLLRHRADRRETDPLFVLPKGRVVLIGVLCFVMFLAEGAMLDWSAVFLTLVREFDASHAGLGYAAFAVAMTFGRLTGDRLVEALGRTWIVLAGAISAAAGLLVAVAVPSGAAALAGFGMVGLGASNVVPVLFTAAGRQTSMAPGLAISAITAIGYAGLLIGPAAIGFIAEATSLPVALGAVALLMLGVAAGAKTATR